MIISKTLKVYEKGNMIIFYDTTAGLMQAVPKGAARVYPFQAPDVGFRFVDIRSNKTIAQIADFAQVQDEAGAAWGATFLDALEALCLFFSEDTITTSAINSTIQSDADALVVRQLDFNLLVAEGLYQNRSVTVKDGINFDVDSGSVPQDLWDNGGTYTGFVTAPAAAELVVAGADTGTVFYFYLASATDTNYSFGSVAIAGAGTYPLGHNIYRCNFAYFVASTAVFNVGLMTIRHTATPANIFVTIPVGFSQSYCAAYTVPNGATAYIDRITTNLRSNVSGQADGYFYYDTPTESPRLRFPHEYSNQLYFDDIDFLIRLPSGTDIVPRITFSSANNLVPKISYRIILVLP